MPFTQSDLQAINQAITGRRLRVTMNGRTVEYRSVAEMISAKREIERELAEAAALDDGGLGRLRRIRTAGF